MVGQQGQQWEWGEDEGGSEITMSVQDIKLSFGFVGTVGYSFIMVCRLSYIFTQPSATKLLMIRSLLIVNRRLRIHLSLCIIAYWGTHTRGSSAALPTLIILRNCPDCDSISCQQLGFGPKTNPLCRNRAYRHHSIQNDLHSMSEVVRSLWLIFVSQWLIRQEIADMREKGWGTGSLTWDKTSSWAPELVLVVAW